MECELFVNDATNHFELYMHLV